MKKFVMPIVFIFILSLLIIPLIHAAEDNTTTTSEANQLFNKNEELFNRTGEESSIGSSLNKVQEGTNSLVEKEIEIPVNLQKPAHILFRLDPKVSVSLLIITLLIFFFLMIIFVDAIKSFSPLSDRTSTLAGILLALILSVTGTTKSISIFLLNTQNKIKILEGWNAGLLILIFTVAIVSLIVLRKIFKEFDYLKEKEKEKEAGIKIGSSLGAWTMVKNVFSKIAGGESAEGASPYYEGYQKEKWHNRLGAWISKKKTGTDYLIIFLIIIAILGAVYLILLSTNG